MGHVDTRRDTGSPTWCPLLHPTHYPWGIWTLEGIQGLLHGVPHYTLPTTHGAYGHLKGYKVPYMVCHTTPYPLPMGHVDSQRDTRSLTWCGTLHPTHYPWGMWTLEGIQGPLHGVPHYTLPSTHGACGHLKGYKVPYMVCHTTPYPLPMGHMDT